MTKLFKIKAVNTLTKDVKFVTMEPAKDGSMHFFMTDDVFNATLFNQKQVDEYIDLLTKFENDTYNNEFKFYKVHTNLSYDQIKGEIVDEE